MKNHEKELDVIALNLKNVKDVLLCFLDFCENDNEKEMNVSSPDFVLSAYCFLESLKRQKSLIEAAVLTLNYECDILNALYDEQQEAQVNRSA